MNIKWLNKTFSFLPSQISNKGVLLTLLILLGLPAAVLGVQQTTNNQQFASGGKVCHDNRGTCIYGSLCKYLKGTGYECSSSFNDCGVGKGCKVKISTQKTCTDAGGQCVRPDQCNIQGYSCKNNYTGCSDGAKCRINLNPNPQPTPNPRPQPQSTSCAEKGGKCEFYPTCPSGNTCTSDYVCGSKQWCAIPKPVSNSCYGINGSPCSCYANPYWEQGHHLCGNNASSEEVVHNTCTGWWYCLNWKR